MAINTKVSASSNSRLLSESSSIRTKSLARLLSGSTITSPEGDAAGLAVSMRFDAQINRTTAAINNLTNAISFSQTEDGFMSKVAKALDRMSEHAILSKDVMKSDADRALYNAEFSTLRAYVENVATQDFNGVSLFGGITLAITRDSEGDTFVASGVDLGATEYTTVTGTSMSTTATAATALTNVKSATTQPAIDRAIVWSNVTRLQFTNEQLGVLRDNLSAGNRRIKDGCVAEESTRFARYNILVQAGTAMLAQASATPQAAFRQRGESMAPLQVE